MELEKQRVAQLAADAAAAAQPHAEDSVDCTVFAPSSAAPGSLLMVQVFLHTPVQAGEAAALPGEFNLGSTRRGFRGLELPLPRATAVEVELSMPAAQVDAPVQRLVWQAVPRRCNSMWSSPTSAPAGALRERCRPAAGPADRTHRLPDRGLA